MRFLPLDGQAIQNLSHCHKISSQWRIQDFCQCPCILQIFAANCMKMKKFGLRGACLPGASPGSANASVQHILPDQQATIPLYNSLGLPLYDHVNLDGYLYFFTVQHTTFQLKIIKLTLVSTRSSMDSPFQSSLH